jgi:heat shock protein HtpX
MRRILLFAATNIAVIVLLSVVLSALGVDQWLYQQGVGLDLKSLLAVSAIFGMGGSFISLAISKWMAKTTLKVQVIERTTTQQQQWLIATVQRLIRLFMSHPPLEQRPAALERAAPKHNNPANITHAHS